MKFLVVVIPPQAIYHWFTSSNKINGGYGEISKDKTLCRYYLPLQHIENMGLNLTYS